MSFFKTHTVLASSLTILAIGLIFAIPQSQKQQEIRQHAQMPGTQLYVAANGSGNSCTQATPCRQLSDAQSIATPGTTVNVGPGNYSSVSFSKSGASGQPIRYVSTTKWGAVLAAGNNISGNFITLEGFEITGPQERVGIHISGDDNLIKNNKIHNIHKMPANSNGGAALVVASDDYSPQKGNIVEGNVAFDIGQSVGGSQTVQGLYVSTHCTGCKLFNNLVYQIEDFGIHAYHEPGLWLVANNTVFNTGRGILVGPNFTTINNISFDNKSGNFDDRGSSTFSNNLETDPGFVNYKPDGTGDYHLKAGGAGMDKGTATGAPATDIDGTPRPQGAGIDIGAYEGSAPVGNPSTSPSTMPSPTVPFGGIAPCPGNPGCPPSVGPSVTVSAAPSMPANPSPTNMGQPGPTDDPCLADDAAIAHGDKNDKKKNKHNKPDGDVSGFFESLLKFFIELINALLKLLGGNPIDNPNPTPNPGPSGQPSLAPDPC